MDYLFLSKTSLFSGTTPLEIESMLDCLNFSLKTYSKGEIIFYLGSETESIGLVLDGSVNSESNDIYGNKTILSHTAKGQIFAASYASVPNEPLRVNVVSAEKSTVLFLTVSKLLQTCPSSCFHHHKLVENLLRILAQKNLNLSSKILHTSSKSIRGRLISYFSEQAFINNTNTFSVPFNRQQLADYLNVDRSALCKELSKMRNDNIIEYHKNSFLLKQHY